MVPQIQGNVSIGDLPSLVQKAMSGDVSTLPFIQTALDNLPALCQEALNITKRVEKAWITTIAQQDLLTQESLIREVADLKRTLQADFSSPLESLVVEMICTTWLAWKQAELSAVKQLQRYGNALTQTQQNHLTACQKRYLLAVKELARIRQLLAPRTTTVVNIADKQQVNIA